MGWLVITGAVLVAATPLLAAPQQKPEAVATDITLRGCVTAGAEKDAFVLTQVAEVPQAGRSVMPQAAHGRRIVFWLDDEKPLAPHAGKMVEVAGTLGKIQESEIELKAGPRKDGGLLVEFEGPGKDVVVPNSTVGGAVGTTGRTAADENDIKTFLLPVDVQAVKVIEGTCQ